MNTTDNLNAFLQPSSVAVIGATERPGSWGSAIMEGLFSWKYPGPIYPVNRQAKIIYGLPAFKDICDIEQPVDLAILTIPSEHVEEAIRNCGEKGVRGITIITAGFGESIEGGRKREMAMTELAHSYGMRLLGPNVSGTFNLHAKFNAMPPFQLYPSSLAIVSQGGYACSDLLSLGVPLRMGVGKFIHTGNECDLTVTDFLEYFGTDPEVQAVIMYLETIRDGDRFLEVARRVTKVKPVIIYKAGKTPEAARAASSHTGALAGRKEIFEGVFRQAGVIQSPNMELLLPLAHAIIEKPPLRGNRVGIITIGGSWGVALTDALGEEGLNVPELSSGLQEKIRALGMPDRASTKNPVDIGAAGYISLANERKDIGRLILESGEVDALIFHGMGRPGILTPETPEDEKSFFEFDKMNLRGFSELEKETGKPVFIGTHYSIWESQTVCDLNKEGIRTYNRLDVIAQILSRMHNVYQRNRT
ncbi:MAG: acetate--CoA ligase family protein [Smithellaceae bacterium]